VDGFITEFYHMIVVPYRKPPEEVSREYLGIFVDENNAYAVV
jgi:hypothetical protein